MSSKKGGRVSVGHPVDVASGIVFLEREDFALPGVVPLVWSRRYGTDRLGSPPSILGPGWTARAFMTLRMDIDGFAFEDGDGSEIYFDDVEGIFSQTGILRDPGTQVELRWEEGLFKVVRYGEDDDPTIAFVFRPTSANGPWPLAWTEEPAGWRLEILYDEHDRPVYIVQNREKNRVRIEYDLHNRLTRLVLESSPEIELAHYEYDALGRLIAAYDSGGIADRYEYDDQDYLTTDNPRGSGAFTFRYDARGRCIFTTGHERYQERSFTYEDMARTTVVVDSHGYTTLYHWNEVGQIESETSPLGAVKVTRYDDMGRVIEQIDSMGGSLKFEYDALGRIVAIIDPLNQTYRIEYNQRHLLVTLIDALGNTSRREYDHRGFLTATINPLSRRWEYSHDPNGDLIKVLGPEGATMVFLYDERGQEIAHSDWQGHFAHFVYDRLGRIIEYTDVVGNTTRVSYNVRGDLLRIAYPNGTEITANWDDAGNLTSITNANGNTYRFEYGVHGHLVSIVNPRGGRRHLEWDSEPGRLLKEYNEKGEVYSLEYDADGRVIRETGFGGNTLEFEYNAGALCIAMTNGVSERIVMERDVGGRLIKKVLPDGSEVIFEYDRHNYIIRAANLDCTISFERDPLGEVVKESQNEVNIESGYSSLSNRLWRRTSLGHETRFDYDENSQLISVDFPQGRVSLVRDALGREVERQLPGGATVYQRYDIMSQLSEQWVSSSRETSNSPQQGESIIKRRFVYDHNFNLAELIDNHWGTTRYQCNPEDMITTVFQDDTGSEQFEYDLAGNIHFASDGDRELGPGGRVLRAGSTRYEYDHDGRLIAKIDVDHDGNEERWSYQWSAEDRLRKVITPQGEVWLYAYDPLGRRVSKSGPTGTARYIWDGNAVVHEILEKDQVKSWLFENKGFVPFAKLENDAIYYVVLDQIGTPREFVHGDGRLAWAARLKTWGEIDQVAVADINCPIRFQSQWYDDETGWCYNWFRYYDPTLSLYTSADPLGIFGNQNPYQYVPNPTSWVDPYGLLSKGGGPFHVDQQGNMYRSNGTPVPIVNNQSSTILTSPGDGSRPAERRGFLSGWGEGVTDCNAARNRQHPAIQRATRGGAQGNWSHGEMHALNWILRNQSRFRGRTVTLQIDRPPCEQGGPGQGCTRAFQILRNVLRSRGIRLRVIHRNVNSECP